MDEGRVYNLTIGDVVTSGSSSHINVGILGGTKHSGPSAELAAYRDELLSTNPKTSPEIQRATLISEKGQRVDGTCEWIRENDTYKCWLTGETTLLWISGGPGKGKTMLSVFLTEQLEIEGVQTIYYFCKSNNANRDNAAAILRGLLWHITEKQPQLSEHLRLYCKTLEKAQASQTSREVLWAILVDILRDPHLNPTSCVLDGLDECDDDSQTWLVAKLVDLTSTKSLTTTRIALVSRPIRGLERSAQPEFENWQERFQLTEKSRREIEIEILRRAEGTFLWVGFAMTELLKKNTAMDVYTALQSLPKGLPTMYGRMLCQVKQDHRHTSIRILRWVTMATRPLSLLDLSGALGTQSSANLSMEQTVANQISHCGLLVKIDGNTTGLVHQSARDYLIRDEIDADTVLEDYRIKPVNAHFKLLSACLNKLEQHRQTLPDMRVGASLPPLLDYAVDHWPDHARGSSSMLGQMLNDHEMFKADSKLRDAWWECRRPSNSFTKFDTSSFYTASVLGIPPWLDLLLKETRWSWLAMRMVKKYDARLTGSLHRIVEQGDDRAVALLLASGMMAVDEKDVFGRSPLNIASYNGSEALVRLLLDASNTDVNPRDNSGQTPLHLAAKMGHTAAIKLLLAASNIDVNARDRAGWTPLYTAADEGHEAVVKLLLAASNIDVNARHRVGVTPLYTAARKGHEAVAKLLLAVSNIDVNARGNSGQTPLYIASWKGHEAVIKLLLATSDIEVNVRYYRNMTPLYVAAWRGHDAVVKLLLAASRIDVNPRNNKNETLLSVAAAKGHEAVVKLLLAASDINVHPRDDNNGTPLSVAAAKGHEAVVKLLLAASDTDGDPQDGRNGHRCSSQRTRDTKKWYHDH